MVNAKAKVKTKKQPLGWLHTGPQDKVSIDFSFVSSFAFSQPGTLVMECRGAAEGPIRCSAERTAETALLRARAFVRAARRAAAQGP